MSQQSLNIFWVNSFELSPTAVYVVLKQTSATLTLKFSVTPFEIILSLYMVKHTAAVDSVFDYVNVAINLMCFSSLNITAS